MRRFPMILAVGLACLAGAIVFLLPEEAPDSAMAETPEVQRAVEPAAIPAVAVTTVEGTAFDTNYGDPAATAEDDLRAVDEILGMAMLLLKDFHEIPLADNADFVRLLSGENPHKVAWIRPGHPAVDARGELLDRWGSPVFFHRESSSRTSLRSAGPDRRMWTDDDIVLDPEPTQ